ncbi:MAG: TetR/AcrR family transcriptional regulator [Candidatus Cloacimonetes bacterium]|nr:TetR/AcrR family transcriptional regulator [Candidatus Cloacimonadota bacterium]
MELSSRQQEIVEISIRLIAEHGIQYLTVKNIAREMGFSEPALYRHFESKADIILAILDSFQKISAFVLTETEQEELSSIQKIEKFLFDRYARFSADPAATRVMFSEGIFQDEEKFSRKMLEIMHQHAFTMQTIITNGQKDGEIRTDVPARELFRIIFGSMRLLVNQWCLSDFNFDLKLEGQLLWQGVRKLLS